MHGFLHRLIAMSWIMAIVFKMSLNGDDVHWFVLWFTSILAAIVPALFLTLANRCD